MKITPPEGYEIDKEKSTFEKIVFKKTEEKLTYEEIMSKLSAHQHNYYIGVDGNIKKSFTGWRCPNTAPTEHQLKKLLAINKLMTVAYYLNDGWEPDWENQNDSKYSLAYDSFDHKIVALIFELNYVFVYFKSKELAQQAIEILGEETIKFALGVL